MSWIKANMNTVLTVVVTLAAYLFGVVPAEGGLSDVSTQQWLGAIVFVGAAFGLNKVSRDHDPTVVATQEAPGEPIIAGPASRITTGVELAPTLTVGDAAAVDEPF